MFLFQTFWFGLAFLCALQSSFLYQHIKVTGDNSKTTKHCQQDFFDLVIFKPPCFFTFPFFTFSFIFLHAIFPLSYCISEALLALADRKYLCSVLHTYSHSTSVIPGSGCWGWGGKIFCSCSLRLLTWEFLPVHKAATIVASPAHCVYFLHVLLGGQRSF